MTILLFIWAIGVLVFGGLVVPAECRMWERLLLGLLWPIVIGVCLLMYVGKYPWLPDD